MLKAPTCVVFIHIVVLVGICEAGTEPPSAATSNASAQAEKLVREIVVAGPGTLEELQRPYFALEKIGSAAVPATLRTIHDPELLGSKKATLIAILGKIGGSNNDARKEILKETESNVPAFRTAAYDALASIGDAAAAESLLELYKKPTLDTEQLDDIYLQSAVLSIKNTDAIPVFLKALEDDSPPAGNAGFPCLLALKALTKLPLTEAQMERAGDSIERLITNSKYDNLKSAAIAALPEFKDENAAKRRLERIEKLNLAPPVQSALKAAKEQLSLQETNAVPDSTTTASTVRPKLEDSPEQSPSSWSKVSISIFGVVVAVVLMVLFVRRGNRSTKASPR